MRHDATSFEDYGLKKKKNNGKIRHIVFNSAAIRYISLTVFQKRKKKITATV